VFAGHGQYVDRERMDLSQSKKRTMKADGRSAEIRRIGAGGNERDPQRLRGLLSFSYHEIHPRPMTSNEPEGAFAQPELNCLSLA
jgi:hypothetical protein